MLKKLIAASVVAVGSVAGASAATVNFGGGNAYLGSSVDYGDFTVTGWAGGLFNESATVSRSAGGLGVFGAPDDQPYHLDGMPIGSAEALNFDFGQTVTLTGITFSGWDGNDEYEYFYNGALQGVSFAPSWTGALELDSFAVAAVGTWPFDGFFSLRGNDEMKVASISYDLAPIPVPASALLLLSSILGMGLIRRRKTAA